MKHLSILAFIASTGAAFAGGASYDISGTTVGKSENQYIPLGETHMFIDLNSKYTLPDNGTPMAGMTGECMGWVQVPMAAVFASGAMQTATLGLALGTLLA